MIINKFTLAAALSIGIMASTTYAGLTQDLTTAPSANTLAACPLSGCPAIVTPQTATCPSCAPACDACAPVCDPCATGAACPCALDPCCPPVAVCPAPTPPACAICPNTCKDKFKQQVYAYPNAIFGGNDVIGERNNAVFTGDSLTSGFSGIPVARANCGCGSPCCTGAAASVSSCGCGYSDILTGVSSPNYGKYGYEGFDYGFNGASSSMLGYSCGSCGMTGAAMPIVGCGCAPAMPVSSCGCGTCGCGCGYGISGAAAPIPGFCPAPCASGIPVTNDACCCPIQIHTETSTTINRRSLVPFSMPCSTGAAAPCASSCATPCAAPFISAFTDVPSGFWAGCDINKLTENNVIAGFPDKTFKPHLPVTRAEMASLIAKGYNLNDKLTCPEKTFRDVPASHWANKTINNAVANGMMVGYPGNKFKPNQPISRAEALTILSKGINCPMDECKANEILGQYCDVNTVPNWAKISIAKAIQSGAMSDFPCPNMISPNKDAERAEIASMLENVRVALGYSCVDKTATASPECNCAAPASACATPCASPCLAPPATGGAAFMIQDECMKIPTLNLCFRDEVTAKAAHVGDRFAAVTTDPVTINGCNYPCGSRVDGKVLEVVRPSAKCPGALKLSFNSIKNGDCKTDLPNQVLSAQVCKMKNPNIFTRIIQAPFTLVGGILGDVGRTVGGSIITASNALDNTVQGVGIAAGEIVAGPCTWPAAGRSVVDVVGQVIMAPIDVTRTALSGTVGALQYTGDELSYLVDPNGNKISAINPREKVTIAFGCQSTK